MSDISTSERKTVLIGLEIDPVTAKEFAKYVDETTGNWLGNLHITIAVAYDWGYSMNDIVSSVIDALEDYCESCDDPSLIGETSGLARFNASESSDGRDVFVALVQIDGLCALQRKIKSELKDKYVEFADSFDSYTPHITLGYLSETDQLPANRIDPIGLAFNRVIVKTNDIRYALPIESDDPVDIKMDIYVEEL